MIQTHIRYNSLSINQLISDLNWIVKTKSLIRSELPEFEGNIMNSLLDFIGKEEYDLWYADLVNSPEKLKNYFENNEQLILGKYFERLLNYFFSSFSTFEIVHAGKQIFEKQTTIGELDFVIKDKRDNKIIHFEVAVKYYMGYKNVGKHDLWIGPNGSDTLQRKMKKLDKQLQLSKKTDIEVNSTFALILGYFFKHIESNNWPYFYEERTGEGEWLYENEMEGFFSNDKNYVILPKNRWLSFYLDKQNIVKNGIEVQKEISLQIQSIGKGIMLAELDASKNVLNKYIVAPNRWPKL